MIQEFLEKYIGDTEIRIGISSLVLAVAGWIVTYILAVRAQKKLFKDNIYNEARITLARALSEYQSWNTKILVDIGTLDTAFNSLRNQPVFKTLLDEFKKLIGADMLEWGRLLEEYQVLFPETVECRKELVYRYGQINKHTWKLVSDLGDGSYVSSNYTKLKELTGDQMGLILDLRMYLQNRCLSSFTGHKVPERIPGDPSVAKIVQDEKGNLQIIEKQ